jgi:hypothetical protein
LELLGKLGMDLFGVQARLELHAEALQQCVWQSHGDGLGLKTTALTRQAQLGGIGPRRVCRA